MHLRCGGGSVEKKRAASLEEEEEKEEEGGRHSRKSRSGAVARLTRYANFSFFVSRCFASFAG